MPRRFIRKYLPSPSALRESAALRPLGERLHDPLLWHLHRRSVAGAVFIGLFCAFLPLPLQMLIAGAVAVIARCNLPLSVALVWITNPVTFGPMFFFAYKLGAWLLNSEPVVHKFEVSASWLLEQLSLIWQPLLLGSLVCGWVAGVTGFVAVHVAWRLHVVRRWRERRLRRAAHALEVSRAVRQPD
jgi:uncharacterized protein (DUF2062 family)